MKEAVEASATMEVVLKAVLEVRVKVTAKLEAEAAALWSQRSSGVSHALR